jgi:hypothetical protein
MIDNQNQVCWNAIISHRTYMFQLYYKQLFKFELMLLKGKESASTTPLGSDKQRRRLYD